MDTLTAPQLQFAAAPDRVIMPVDDLAEHEARYLAIEAVSQARLSMPRVTSRTAMRLQPIYGDGYFGIYFPDPWVWFQEHGTSPFTMKKLAGKTIPMWVEDPGGVERAKNPKIRTRTTDDGRLQVLIFRRAARLGQRKTVTRKSRVTGKTETVDVPMSYPGAPGRIVRREAPSPFTAPGRRGGAIAAGNVGVRWRHPGLRAQQYLNSALARTAFESGLLVGTVYFLDAQTFEYALSFAISSQT